MSQIAAQKGTNGATQALEAISEKLEDAAKYENGSAQRQNCTLKSHKELRVSRSSLICIFFPDMHLTIHDYRSNQPLFSKFLCSHH